MIYRITPQQPLLTAPAPHQEPITDSTPEAFLQWLHQQKSVAVDVENSYRRSNELLTCQFGAGLHQWVLDARGWTKDTPLVQDIGKTLSTMTVLGHNLKHDLHFLRPLGWRFKVWDTFLVECLLTAGLRDTEDAKMQHPLGLDDLLDKYLQIYLPKSYQTSFENLMPQEGLSDRLTLYCAGDVRHLHQLAKAQMQLPRWQLIKHVAPLEFGVTPVFSQIELNGVPIDKKQWLEVAALTSQMLQASQDRLDALVLEDSRLTMYRPPFTQGDLFAEVPKRPIHRKGNSYVPFNWGSWQQLQPLLRRFVPTLDSTREAVIARHRKAHPVFEELLAFNKVKKLTEAFGVDFLDHLDRKGRVHSEIWQILSTGRISVSKPNMNQVPSRGDLARKIRAAVYAPAGYKFVGGDYSGMELRIIAEFSQDPVWLDAFRTGKDLHSVLCCLTFGIEMPQVKTPFPKKPSWSYRDVQKTINFG